MYFLIVSEARGLKPKSVGRVGLLWGLPRGLHMAVVALSSQGCSSACVVCSLISSFCKDTTHTGLSPSPYAKKMDAFEPWCWRRLLKFPWTTRRSNQSVLRKINPEYSLEGLMLKLKLQDFGHLMWTDDSLQKSLMLGKIESRRGGQRMGWLDGITDAMKVNLGKLWEMVRGREAWRTAVLGVQNWTWLGDWTMTATYHLILSELPL